MLMLSYKQLWHLLHAYLPKARWEPTITRIYYVRIQSYTYLCTFDMYSLAS